MKKIVLVLALLALTTSTGCSKANGSSRYQPDKYCVDGVLYLKFPTGVSVAYNIYGAIKTCNVDNY